MPTIKLHGADGKESGNLKLDDKLFGLEPNVAVMHRKMVAERNNARVGSHDTLTRAEVAGGGRKPWKQKHTGRARHGSFRSPIFRHGGIAHGPHPRSYAQDVNKKEKRLALQGALSARIADGSVVAVKNIPITEIKTKAAAEFLTTMGAGGQKTLVLIESTDTVLLKSFRNLPGVVVRTAPAFSLIDVLDAERIIATEQALKNTEEVWSK